jgi:hypothetical protein
MNSLRLFLCALSVTKVAGLTISDLEYFALYDLYNSTGGNRWTYYGYSAGQYQEGIPWDFNNASSDPCLNQWQGVSCYCSGPASCNVQQLILSGHNLVGFLPSSISNLSNLTHLSLAYNNITQSVPSSITSLIALEELNLENNLFTGEIPSDIGNLVDLRDFNLVLNSFTSTLPSSLFSLTNLQSLVLDFNLFNGTLSSDIGNLRNLQNFSIAGNYFNGSFPSTIGNCEELRFLRCSSNFFSSSLPIEIFNKLLQLQILDFQLNALTGTIPTAFQNLTQLTVLTISYNQLYGVLNDDLFDNVTHLQNFYVDNNLFSKGLPSSLSSATHLSIFSIGGNSFTGTIPSEYSIWNNIYLFEAQDCFLYGSNLPSIVTNHSHLSYFQVNDNLFSGILPAPYTKNNWTAIYTYITSGNYFSGTIPTVFEGSVRLHMFDLGDNILSGSFPTFFTQLDNPFLFLFNVNFSFNYFSHNLNNAFNGSYPQLAFLSLNNNQFTGSIPTTFFNLIHMVYLLLNNNQLTGTLSTNFVKLNLLEILFVQYNRLTGSLPQTLMSSVITNVDVSNNQLTGILGSNLFIAGSESLETFSASSNCFHGTLPGSLCDLTHLNSLALDGLSTATSCRNLIFPSSSKFFKSFTLQYSMAGTIPMCLFSLPQLTTLHLSGNEFTGTLDDDMTISPTLVNLDLAFNYFEGTLPNQFQQHYWDYLDLHYNSFTGTITHFSNLSSSESLVHLRNNRLSGFIPDSLKCLTHIEILDGNIFSCFLDNEKHLPRHDPKFEDYSCGSDATNAFVYLWLCCLFCFCLLLFITFKVNKPTNNNESKSNRFVKCYQDFRKFVWQLHVWRTTFITIYSQLYHQIENENAFNNVFPISNLTRERQGSDSSSTSSDDSLSMQRRNSKMTKEKAIFKNGLLLLYLLNQKLRFFCLVLTIMVVLLYMPVFTTLSSLFPVYEFQYAWVISPLYLTGEISGILLTVLLLFFLFVVIFLFQHVWKFLFIRFSVKKNPIVSNRLDRVDVRHLKDRKFLKEHRLFQMVIYGIITFVNLMIMMGADVLYVVSVESFDSEVIFFSEIALVALKLFIGKNLLWWMIPWLRRKLIRYFIPNITQEMIENEISFDYLLSNDILFLSFTILLNNLFYPILAIMIVSPECFYRAFYASSVVKSNYSYTTCSRYSISQESCVLHYTQTNEVTYDPPFKYDYACSSIIYTYYIPIFMFMAFVEGMLLPFFLFLHRYVCDVIIKKQEKQRLLMKQFNEQRLSTGKTSVVISQNIKTSGDLNRHANLEAAAVSSMLTINNPILHFGAVPSTTNKSVSYTQRETLPSLSIVSCQDDTAVGLPETSTISRFEKFLLSSLPVRLKELNEKPAPVSKKSLNAIFNRHRYLVKINTYLVIFVAYGTIFPPLAVIICFTIFVITYSEEIIIGRLLSESKRLQYLWYEKQLSFDCAGLMNPLKHTLFLVIPVSAILFSFLIFDIFGFLYGWETAVIVVSVVISASFIFTFLSSRITQLGGGETPGMGKVENERKVRLDPIVQEIELQEIPHSSEA